MIDLDKKYTSNGNEVIAFFHFPDNDIGTRLIAHIKRPNGQIRMQYFYEEGNLLCNSKSKSDLVEAKPEPQQHFIIIYFFEDGTVMGSKVHNSRYVAEKSIDTGSYILHTKILPFTDEVEDV